MIEKFVKIDEKIVIEKEKLKLSDKTQTQPSPIFTWLTWKRNSFLK